MSTATKLLREFPGALCGAPTAIDFSSLITLQQIFNIFIYPAYTQPILANNDQAIFSQASTNKRTGPLP